MVTFVSHSGRKSLVASVHSSLCFFFLKQVKGSFYFLYFQSFQRVARVEPEQPVSFLLSSTPIFVVEDCGADAQPKSRNPSRYWWKLGAIFRRHSDFYGREDSIFWLQGQFWKQFLYYFPSTLTPFCRKRYCKMVVFVMHSMGFWWQARSFQPKCYPRAFALKCYKSGQGSSTSVKRKMQRKIKMMSGLQKISRSNCPVRPIVARTHPIFGQTNIDNNNIEPLNILKPSKDLTG